MTEKAVMISIQPKWIEKIASGEKTIEVRKTRPKIETPFKVLIYCTDKKPSDNSWQYKPNLYLDSAKKVRWIDVAFESIFRCQYLQQKVIGEYTCDKLICCQAYFDDYGKNHLTNIFDEDIRRTCLTEYELWNYIAGKAVKANQMFTGWLWHISDLIIYDKPKELSEFKKPCIMPDQPYCPACKFGSVTLSDDEIEYAIYHGGQYDTCEWNCNNVVKRPPQSWCYVEEN